MVHVLVRHKVADYDKWRPVFDNAFEFRKSSGEVSFQIFRNSADPSEVIGIFGWESLEKAKSFFESEDLKQKMQDAGVTSQPDVVFLDRA